MTRWTAPGIFVAAWWLAMVWAAFAYVDGFTSVEPFGDEWDLLPGIVGEEPIQKWLWVQHNEHRLPLPKLVYFGLMQATGYNARAGSFATVLLLAALSGAFVIAARRLRGRVDFADAFFPIALLNWGHFENYLIGFQIGFAMSMGLACAWLLLALPQGRGSDCHDDARRDFDSEPDDHQSRDRQGARLVATLLLPCLALSGAHGIVYVPPLGLATLWLTRRDSPTSRLIAWTGVAISLAIVGLYFVDYHRPGDHPPSAGVLPSVAIAGQFLSLGWGWIAQMIWPASGVFTAAFLAASTILIGTVSARRRESADGSLVAILAMAAGTVTLALGIGWGRSGFGPMAGFADRYALIAFPVVGAGYLLWVRHGGRLFNSLVPMAMLSVALLSLTQHGRTGWSEGRMTKEFMDVFASDLATGKSPTQIATDHPKVFPFPDRFARRIELLRNAGVARYRNVGTD